MSRWWRAHDEAVDDPKLQQLPGELFKAWFNLCCITSQNAGRLPALGAIAFKLHTTEAKAKVILDKLRAAGLIDDKPDHVTMHNWDKRQYKSDVSNERVQRFRERQRNGECNVTGNGHVTPSEPDTEQIQKTEKSEVKNLNGRGKRGPPPHGTISESRGTIFIAFGTNDWADYAADFRAARGFEPKPNSDGGYWFKTAGAAPPPPPKRLERH